MSTTREKILLLLSDLIAINLASISFLWVKFVGGTLENVELSWTRLHPQAEAGPSFWYALNYYFDVLAAIYGFWLLLFLFNGMYRAQYSQSRFDEVIGAFKVVTVGALLWFVATFNPDEPLRLTRALIFSYWLALISLVAGGRGP